MTIGPRQDDGEQCENRCLPHSQFWLGVLGIASGVLVSYTTLTYEVRELNDWQDRVEPLMILRAELEREKVLLQKEILANEVATKALCAEIKRLAIELKRVPTNNCGLP